MKLNSDHRAERKRLTVLFSDLTDSTGIAASVEAEHYAVLLDRLRECYETVILRHGGVLAQVRGDGVLAVFGLEAREDEGRRATEAALELHEAVRNIPTLSGITQNLSMHSGIHSGRVILAEGDSVYGQYVLIGDAANIASRLSDAAEANEIFVSDLSLGAERYFFVTGDRFMLRVKGRPQSLGVYAVVGHSDAKTRFEARARLGLSTMVGRQPELDILQQTLAKSRQEGAGSIWITAPPGMGKTRLVSEFLEISEERAIIFRGYCESYLDAQPLQPIMQIVQQAQALNSGDRRDGALMTSALIKLGELISSPGGFRDSEFSELLLTFLSNLTLGQAVVIFIDDFQWADDASRRLVSALCAEEIAHLLVIVASREIHTMKVSEYEILTLQPLTREQSASMIQALAPGSNAKMTAQIYDASGGNPLFVEELCHSTKGMKTDTLLTEFVANDVKMLIESRIALLQDEQADLLRCAAVIGSAVPKWLLGEVAGVTEIDTLVDELAEHDLLFTGDAQDTFRFKHGITREVVLNSVGLHVRRELHLAIAQAIEKRYSAGMPEQHLESLSYHYGETDQYQQAADYAEAAGDKAMAIPALDRARLQYQAALKALDPVSTSEANYGRWMSVIKKLSMACLYDAQREQVLVFNRALQLATERDDEEGIIEAEYRLAYIHYALGDGAKAVMHSQQAKTLVADTGRLLLSVQIDATLGQSHAIACQYEHAMTALNSAVDTQRAMISASSAQKHRGAPGFAYTLASKAMILGDQGQFVEALNCFDEADEVVQGANYEVQLSVASLRSGVYLWQGRWDAALERAQVAVTLAERIGSAYMAAISSACAGYANWRLKNDPEAHQLEQSMSWISNHDQWLWSSMQFGWLAEVMQSQKNYERTRHYAAWALQRARRQEKLGEVAAFCALANIPIDAGNKRGAAYYFARARKSARLRESPRELANVDFSQAQLELTLGKKDLAQQLLRTCAAQYSDMGMYWHAAAVQQLGLEHQLTV